MNLITAVETVFNVYRGHPMELKHLVLDKDENPMDISNTDVVLRITHSLTDAYSLVEVEGELVTDGSDGKVSFFLTSETTEDLLLGAYTISTIVKLANGKYYPAFTGRMGLLGVAPPVEEGG